MANPTTAKPTTPEWDATPSIASGMLTFIACEGTGILRDVKNNVIGQPFRGYTGGAMGHHPELVAGAFTVNSLSDPVYRWKGSAKSVRFVGTGFTSAATLPYTMAIVFRHQLPSSFSASAASNSDCALWGVNESNTHHGLGLRINNTAGNVRLTIIANGISSVYDTGIVLAANTWYAVAVTFLASNQALIQVYDYGAQAALAGTPTTVTHGVGSTASPGFTNNGWTLCNSGQGATGTHAFQGDIYVACAHSSTWDSGTNSFFADFYTDPFAVARGTYSRGSGALTAGQAATLDCKTDRIILGALRSANGGTGATPTYQWQRSTDASTYTDLTGQTSLYCEDTTAAVDTTYWYRCKMSTVETPGTTANTTPTPGRLTNGTVSFLHIGDSNSTNDVAWLVAYLLYTQGYRVNWLNRSVGTTSVYNGTIATSSWQPSSSQPGAYLLDRALAEATVCGLDVFHCTLGTNDSSTAADFKTYLGNLCNAAIANGMDVIVSKPPLTTATPSASVRYNDYWTKALELVNGTTIFEGTDKVYNFVSQDPYVLLSADGLHYAASGHSHAAAAFAEALHEYLDPIRPSYVGPRFWDDEFAPVRETTA